MSVIAERIAGLRAAMQASGCGACLVPGTDPHQSEYVPDAWQRRRWMSGFTGSRGDLAITRSGAGLWTDSRYFLQAEKELAESGITLFRIGVQGTPSINAWALGSLDAGQAIGVDPHLLSADAARDLEAAAAQHGVEVRWLEENPVDPLWTDRPGLPSTPAVPQPAEYAGESVRDKLARVRGQMADARAGVMAVTALDAIAWLFNLRGRDIEYNPLSIAYALITAGAARLFIDRAKVSPALQDSLAGIADVERYEDFADALAAATQANPPAWVDPAASHAVAQIARENGGALLRPLPITLMKAIKNRAEVDGAARAHLSDGLAMVRFLHWLETAVAGGGVTEMSAAARLEAFRARDPLYRGPSFATISSYGEHGAIVHYRPSAATDATLGPDGLYLLDSGGQYADATTDITRTVAFGLPSALHREVFTLVLKGQISLASALFPAGTRGVQLDTLARLALWERGLDYGHGTGHGIGSYLCVHEGPQSMSPVSGFAAALVEGMILSIEPGYYRAGEFGVRTENLTLVVPADSAVADFLRFETLTLCPIDLALVEPQLLDQREIRWLNEYHTQVRETLTPHLEPDVRAWLAAATTRL
jgi:Xaa-Pro aminopeptidase